VNVRHVLIVLNVAAIAVFAVAAWLLLRRNRGEERTPANLTPFYDDEDLESRRLERVLGWALICAAVIAVTLPIYWLREPNRQAQSIAYFDQGSIDRGATLFASPGMPAYDSTVSLQCANCHGQKGEGGAVPWVYTDPDTGKAERVFWKAPPLNTELLRFSDQEVTDVITYGRPGTPMQAFGVDGGGPKNEQSIQDLVDYIRTLQLTSQESQAEATKGLSDAKAQPQQQLKAAKAALTKAQKDLAKVEAEPNAKPAALAAARKAVADAQANLDWAQNWADRNVGVTDGQYLFQLYCARCHTKGWSIFDPTTIGSTKVLGPAGEGGGIGFNLGNEKGRFPKESDQIAFVTTGSEAFKPYGDQGQGSGRMPGFGVMLTPQMIKAIVEYERDCLSVTDPAQPAALQKRPAEVPACDVAKATVKGSNK
jgi:mono/diheme cytochrome c family protein